MIEVLIALAIAVLALGALFGLARTGLTGAARAEAETAAAALAQSSLEAMGTVTPLADGGTADLDQGRFHLHATVARADESGSNGYLVPYALSATVSWRDDGGARSLTLRTLRLGPPQ